MNGGEISVHVVILVMMYTDVGSSGRSYSDGSSGTMTVAMTAFKLTQIL